MKLKDAQKYYYNIQISSGSPPNGPGSLDSFILKEGTIDYINQIIDKYNIENINDCPSGVYGNWIHLLKLPQRGINYVGYDINDLIVERNKTEYPSIEFVEFDMTKQVPPKGDLIICRDALFHLPNEMVIQSLNNFKESGSTYLLATEQWWLKENYELTQKELDMGCGYRPINLEITPFFLGKPLETHIENDGIDEGRNIGLWKIN